MTRFLKKVHKWVGLLIGIQVLLWLLSGLVIGLLDPAKVSGKQWRSAEQAIPQTLGSHVLLEPSELPAGIIDDAQSVFLSTLAGEPVYRVKHSGSEVLVNAVDGSPIQFDQVKAGKLAREDFTGDGEVESIERGTAPDMETRNHSGAYWRVDFSDRAGTSIYIGESNGKILERRNNYWRVRDFFWMLHIMDYPGRENFNNTLIIGVALVAIWLGISGFLLLFGSFKRRDFFFLNILGKRGYAVITLIGPGLDKPVHLRLRKDSNLFLSLATHDVDLPSICGGGGECGKCRIQIDSVSLPEPGDIERGLIPKRLRENGFRLACQQEVTNDMTLYLPRKATTPV